MLNNQYLNIYIYIGIYISENYQPDEVHNVTLIYFVFIIVPGQCHNIYIYYTYTKRDETFLPV